MNFQMVWPWLLSVCARPHLLKLLFNSIEFYFCNLLEVFEKPKMIQIYRDVPKVRVEQHTKTHRAYTSGVCVEKRKEYERGNGVGEGVMRGNFSLSVSLFLPCHPLSPSLILRTGV